MGKKIIVSFIITFCMSFYMTAQNEDTLYTQKDSIDSIIPPAIVNDTIAWIEDNPSIAKTTDKLISNQLTFKPNPTKAVIYSAIFPGLGQIYNRKYWKLPIIYGGFLGLTYAISWNGRYYNDYSGAYKAIMSDNPKSDANIAVWGPFLKGVADPSSASEQQIATWRNSFKRNRDSYRRYRDLSIIGAVALYALCMIDAYVDAHLFDFDISPDLSLKVEPAAMSTDRFSGKSFGVQCSIQF